MYIELRIYIEYIREGVCGVGEENRYGNGGWIEGVYILTLDCV